jgi:hypothetical protein
MNSTSCASISRRKPKQCFGQISGELPVSSLILYNETPACANWLPEVLRRSRQAHDRHASRLASRRPPEGCPRPSDRLLGAGKRQPPTGGAACIGRDGRGGLSSRVWPGYAQSWAGRIHCCRLGPGVGRSWPATQQPASPHRPYTPSAQRRAHALGKKASHKLLACRRLGIQREQDSDRRPRGHNAPASDRGKRLTYDLWTCRVSSVGCDRMAARADSVPWRLDQCCLRPRRDGAAAFVRPALRIPGRCLRRCR